MCHFWSVVNAILLPCELTRLRFYHFPVFIPVLKKSCRFPGMVRFWQSLIQYCQSTDLCFFGRELCPKSYCRRKANNYELHSLFWYLAIHFIRCCCQIRLVTLYKSNLLPSNTSSFINCLSGDICDCKEPSLSPTAILPVRGNIVPIRISSSVACAEFTRNGPPDAPAAASTAPDKIWRLVNSWASRIPFISFFWHPLFVLPPFGATFM